MEAIFRFLADYEDLIYLVLAVGGLVAGRWLVKSLKEWRQAVFGLERAFARQRLTASLAAVALILVLVLLEFVFVSFVAPSLPFAAFAATPTLDVLIVPAGGLSSAQETEQAATAAAPVSANSQGCIPNKLTFTYPQPGQEVSGEVTLTGIIKVPGFGFFKYEVAPLGSEAWTTISAGRSVGENGELGLWNTAELLPGDYQLSLVVTDNEGQALPACIIPVRVKGP